MATPIKLDDRSKENIKALAHWVSHAQEGRDYTVEPRGYRIYKFDQYLIYVKPLLDNLNLPDWGFTMYRLSDPETFDPKWPPEDPKPSILYQIPVNILNGTNPQIIKDGESTSILPGWYTVTVGRVEITPELDCLVLGNKIASSL